MTEKWKRRKSKDKKENRQIDRMLTMKREQYNTEKCKFLIFQILITCTKTGIIFKLQ